MCAVRQAVKTLFPFAPNARQKMMGVSDVVLGASVGEARQIRRYFLIPSDKIDVVTYGANEHYLQATPELFEKKWSVRNFILAVGRIEPRKNQLKLIRAANRLGHNLVIIGNPVSHHQSYYDRCQREAGPQVHFLGGLASDSDLLASAFAACAVYVLPSWFETPGLAALEAGLSGAKVVITQGGPTQEYFQDLVDYMNPASEKDIAEKIKKALRRKPSQALRKHINSRYLWKHTAEQTLHIYQKLGFQHTLRSAAIPS